MTLSAEAERVRNALLDKGLETPLVPVNATSEEKKERIAASVRTIMQTLGLDLTDDSLEDTPNRIARMYVDEVFSGLNYENFPKVTLIENKMGVDEMIKVKDITLTSTCEHHFDNIFSR